MKVILAQPRGFCAGVARAVEIVERALAKYGPPVYVLHEIVHNRHVLDRLRALGVRFVESLSDIPAGAVTIYSAHGVAKRVEDEAHIRGLPVLDATCPLVTKVHQQAKRYAAQGRVLIVIGHPGHPEVIGTMGQAAGEKYLVTEESDVARLVLAAETPIAYVTQTTLSVDETANVIAAIKRQFRDVVGPETKDICYATQNRQAAVRRLCAVADVILVVGATHSSNSNRLREIGTECGRPSYLIADGTEIKAEWFDETSVIGLTAGASAPDILITQTLAALKKFGQVETSLLSGHAETVSFRLPEGLDREPVLQAAAI